MNDDLVQRLRSNRPIPTLPHEAADRIESLTAENFKLAAGSCDVEGGKVGDEHGHFYCTLQARVEAQAVEIEQWRECALYDATMEGLVFKGWDRSALERCRRAALGETEC